MSDTATKNAPDYLREARLKAGYEKPATAVWGGITLHPNYEAKTMQWFVKSGLDPGSTLFWIVGAAPRNIPAAGRP